MRGRMHRGNEGSTEATAVHVGMTQRARGTMKKICLALLLSAFAAPVCAQTAQELVADGKNTDNVLTFGMGPDLKMWSPLRQINKSNIKRLVPAWNLSLSNDMGELSQPTVYNGVMYVVNGN